MENEYWRLVRELWEYSCLPYYKKDNGERYIQYKLLHNNLHWEEVFTFVNIGLDRDFYTNVNQIKDTYNPLVLVNKYNQLPQDFIPGDLEVIKPQYNQDNLVLRHNARVAFETMCYQAEWEGLCLKAISTFRSYSYQEQVYYKNWVAGMDLSLYQAERDKVSARAGFSEHQTGLAVDINDLEETFEETPEGRWLAANSYQHGFLLRYPKGKENITGYNYEPWHFRYLGRDFVKKVYKSKLTYDEYFVRYLAANRFRG